MLLCGNLINKGQLSTYLYFKFGILYILFTPIIIDCYLSFCVYNSM